MNFIEQLKQIPDHRKSKGKRHPLWLVMCLTLLGVLSGYHGYRPVQASDGSLTSGLANFIIVVTDPVNINTNQSNQEFNQSQSDKIGLTGGIAFIGLGITQNGTKTEIRNGSDLLATLLNYNNALNPLVSANFVAYP
jgi:hypothetical protein